jgi:hypothetical protein
MARRAPNFTSCSDPLPGVFIKRQHNKWLSGGRTHRWTPTHPLIRGGTPIESQQALVQYQLPHVALAWCENPDPPVMPSASPETGWPDARMNGSCGGPKGKSSTPIPSADRKKNKRNDVADELLRNRFEVHRVIASQSSHQPQIRAHGQTDTGHITHLRIRDPVTICSGHQRRSFLRQLISDFVST